MKLARAADMTTQALERLAALDTQAGRDDPYPHYAALHELGEAVRLQPGSVGIAGYPSLAESRNWILHLVRRGFRTLPVLTG
jgi:hypothetical protein